MPGKKIQCTPCSKIMRSDNFHRHIQSCMDNPTSKNLVEGKRRTSMNVPIDIAESENKIISEMINDSSTEEVGKEKVQSIPPQEVQSIPPQEVQSIPPQEVQSIPPQEVQSIPPQEVQSIPPQEVQSIPPQEVQSIPPQVSFPAPPPDVVVWKEPLRALDLNLQAENLTKLSQPRTQHIVL